VPGFNSGPGIESEDEMKKLLVFVPAMLMMAAAPSGFNEWSASELKNQGEALKKSVKDGLASKVLADWGNHQLMVIHREATGQAEFHAKQIDIIVVRSGQASIKIGGRILDGKTTAPNEIRGTSIEGAEIHPLKEGDVLHVPVKTPHQVMVEAGQSVDYLAIKVDTQ
jgi:mannose-6-phosphate isomerase-like protein (cupin superfamily)